MADVNSVKAFLAAAEVFSAAPDQTQLDNANRWLQEFQQSPEAWATCDYLLQSPDVPQGAQLLAAQTYRMKVTFDLQQFDAAHRIALRDSLLLALRKYASGPRALMVQICLALSGVAIQTAEWTNVVPDMIQSMGQDPTLVPALLEFLTILPEEVSGNSRIPMSNEELSWRANQLLTQNVEQVIQLLTMYLQASGVTPQIQVNIFTCLRSWIVSGEVDVTALSTTPLFQFIFQALNSEPLFDVAVDTICDVIHETQEVDEYMSVIELIVSQLLVIKPALVTAHEDPDKMRGYCRIFVEAGETYRILLLDHEAFFPIVEAIAQCAAYPDLDIVPITFNFWYRLAGSISGRPTVPQEFLNLYKGLVNVMMFHLRYPADPDTSTAEERDEFRAFRHVMGDTLKDCCVVLGSSVCLRMAYDKIHEALSNVSSTWQEIEAPLFSLRSMGAEVDPFDEEIVPLIMDLIPQLPSHPRVRYAATLVISRYTEWIDKHEKYINHTLSYLSSGFESDDIQVTAASGQAMKYLCKDCKQHLVPFLEQLHSFVQVAGQKLPLEDQIQVYEAIAHVISCMPMEAALAALRQFALEIVTKIHTAVSAPSLTRPELEGVSDNLEKLTTMLDVIRAFNEPLPSECATTAAEIWGVLDNLILKYGSTHHTVERLCALLRSGLHFFDRTAEALVPSLLERLSLGFESTSLPDYIWILGKILMRYPSENNNAVKLAMRNSYERVTAKVLEILKGKAIAEVDTTIEDYIQYLLRVFEFTPDLLLLSPTFPSVFQIILQALTLYRQDVIYPTLDLILNVLRHDSLSTTNGTTPTTANFPLYANVIRSAVEAQGFTIVGLLLTGMLTHFPEGSEATVITSFRLLAQYWPQQLATWLPGAVGQIPITSLPASAKTDFVMACTTAIQSGQLDKVKKALTDLHRASRRARDRTRLIGLGAM